MKTAKVTGLGRILIDGELVQLRLRAITGYPEPKQPIVATPAAKVCEPSLQLRVLQDTRSVNTWRAWKSVVRLSFFYYFLIST